MKRLHARAVQSSKNAKLVDYTVQYEVGPLEDGGKEFKYEMVAIEGGSFVMGSPKSVGKKDEHPRNKVEISPFWMGKYEVTWEMFDQFSIMAIPLDSKLKSGDDVQVSRPTVPYTRMDFGMGKGAFPAKNMTQHAASKFCQWISAKTGHFYRLPTEAEWEYACRAGTTGKFSCPEDKIFEYAVCEPNFDNPVWLAMRKSEPRKPNPWGLHDMHGNVMEWCLDQYNSLTYRMRVGEQKDPFIKAYRIYPRVAGVVPGMIHPKTADRRSDFFRPGLEMQ